MGTKDSKMIRIVENNIFCSQITPLNCTNQSVLIFLHDALGCSESWKEFPVQLCDKLETRGFLYDRLGHGKSDTLDSKWSKGYLEAEAYFLREIILSQNFTNFILIGSSDGASIALLYAAKYPDCQAIISIAGHVKVEEATKAGIRNTIQNSEKIIAQLEKYHSNKTARLFQNWKNCWLSEGFSNWNIEDELQKIQCPSLILQGEKDEYATQEHCTNIAKKIGSTALPIIIEGCRHFPYKENPFLISQKINSFLNKRL
ncbi:alpha/beta fold hydrolase [Flavobacterium frigoris]|uniref:Pimeloyl-ACP methyl ester carboxylesterase n=1 Tax=Flavobacterium frigoris TaxID=229204 RepID=A0A1H9FES0_FLAFI|nr:alpha/beta hydrolase [Flavobacterium frigoris]SEQ35953.1 Pimeloyl-ACP methyl ester carboxylesterase [Flavobacterium frigoris]